MMTFNTKTIIWIISFVAYIIITNAILPNFKTVDAISLSGYVDIIGGVSKWNEFTDASSDMMRVTCELWNTLSDTQKRNVTVRYTPFQTTHLCYHKRNKSYIDYANTVYGLMMMNLSLWLVMIGATVYLLDLFRRANKILICAAFLIVFICTCIDLHSLTNMNAMHKMSGGLLFNVNGYVHVDGTRIPIYDQFQLSEMVCKSYFFNSVSHVDVRLRECDLQSDASVNLQIGIKLFLVLSLFLLASISEYFSTYNSRAEYKPIDP